jgi:hypothetical protein
MRLRLDWLATSTTPLRACRADVAMVLEGAMRVQRLCGCKVPEIPRHYTDPGELIHVNEGRRRKVLANQKK